MLTNNISRFERRRRWWNRALQILTTILLTLFLPLSFLLLARLSSALQSHFNGGADDNFLAFLFLYFNSAFLCLLLSFITVAAFVRGLTGGKVTLVQRLLFHHQQPWAAVEAEAVDDDQGRSRLHFSSAWLILCTTVIFVELSIEFHLNGDKPSSSDYHRNIFLRSSVGLLFAVGLYETMLYWSESVVKPVVEDVVVGFTGSASGEVGEIRIKKRRRWVVERVGLGLSFGALWWWRLRDHLDDFSAVIPAAYDDDSDVVLKVVHYVSLGLCILTLCTGTIRAFTVVTGMMLLIIRKMSSKITPPPLPLSGGGVN